MTNGAGGTGGIVTRRYKSGSIIYFEGDKSEYIYILKAGHVILTSIKLDTGEEVKEEVRHGEFFGVKSALGKYPREETAQTVGETLVLVLTLSDFERLILRNVNVVRKMLRVFSNQLRRIGKMVRSVLGESDTINPDAELFRIGEYYYKAGVFQQAQYAFKKYMEYYPDGQYANLAMQRIRAIDSGQAAPADANLDFDAAVEEEPVAADFGGGDSFSDDFSFEEKHEEPKDFLDFDAEVDSSASSPLSSEMDSFLADDDDLGSGSSGGGGGGLDDFGFDEPDLGDALGDSIAHIPEMYHNAEELMAIDNYSEALDLLERIIVSPDAKNSEEEHYQELAHYDAAHCLFQMGSMKEALQSYSTAIKKYPQSRGVKQAMFNIGEIFEKVNQKDKAIAYYNKALNIAPKDSLNAEALNRIKRLQSR